jgi:Arc/MetJ-type ribon-helix-helix transcriptional regulator
VTTHIELNDQLDQAVEEVVESSSYETKTEFVRHAIREAVEDHTGKTP